MTLEKIVRPYMPPPVFSGTPIAPSQPKQPSEAKLVITGTLPGDYITMESGFAGGKTETKQDDNDKKANKKEKEKVRVENPDDPDQYVVVERIKKLTMTDQGTGKKTTWDFTGMWAAAGAAAFNSGSPSAPQPPGPIDSGGPANPPPGWNDTHPDEPWLPVTPQQPDPEAPPVFPPHESGGSGEGVVMPASSETVFRVTHVETETVAVTGSETGPRSEIAIRKAWLADGR